MYCTQCGAENDDAAKLCTRCQATLFRPGSVASGPAQTIPSYLIQSIFITLCCCQIPGIVAIVYAAQVNGLIAGGNFEGARRSSRLAFIWCWVGFGLGAMIALTYVAIVTLGALFDR